MAASHHYDIARKGQETDADATGIPRVETDGQRGEEQRACDNSEGENRHSADERDAARLVGGDAQDVVIPICIL